VLPGSLFLFSVREDRFDEAENTYRDCLKDNPRDVLSLNNLAWLLATKGRDAAEALGHVQKAIDIAGPSVGLLDTRAMVYLTQGQADRAVKELEEVAAEDPSPTSFFHLAQAYRAANNKTAARDNWRRALDGGLKEKDLHPFERDRYQLFVKELGTR